MVVIVSLIVLVVGLSMVGSGYIEISMGTREEHAGEALVVAEAGIHDGIKRLLRNKDCNVGGSPPCVSYSIGVGNGTSTVTIMNSSTAKVIIAYGLVKSSARKIRAEVNFDANNEAAVTSWQEITD
ncbi:MAG: hypothetical protein A2939_03555 [Parcubacteria group bacterium RIFCSPLOWO2_01_FULL_48_18]|nr:MAG: hypothetical protein A2939_03555 [Parcubacteria group bacterium RIFCSPLOWO2_01_FULL_48_18]OHB23126.1 MAG: hypothetical protein A3J67_03175 [Parcubacteria group bacterium RIFCSPHIGHO2_02_FULL_48_10b]